MRDDEHCAPAGAQGLDRVEHPLLALGIEVSARLVEHDQRGVRDEGAGQSEALALTDAQPDAAVPDVRLPALREAGNDLVQAGQRSGRVQKCAIDTRGDVLSERPGQDHRALRDPRDLVPPAFRRDLGKVDRRVARQLDRHRPGIGREQTEDELRRRRLAGPARPGQRHDAPRPQLQRESRRGGHAASRSNHRDAVQPDRRAAQIGRVPHPPRRERRVQHVEGARRGGDPVGRGVEVRADLAQRQVHLGREHEDRESGLQIQVTGDQPQPDADGHQSHRERGDQLEHHAGQERDAQRRHRRDAVRLAELADPRDRSPLPTESAQRREARDEVEHLRAEALHRGETPPRGVLREAPDQDHEDRDEWQGHRDRHRGDPVQAEHHGENGRGDGRREHELGQVADEVRLERVQAASDEGRQGRARATGEPARTESGGMVDHAGAELRDHRTGCPVRPALVQPGHGDAGQHHRGQSDERSPDVTDGRGAGNSRRKHPRQQQTLRDDEPGGQRAEHNAQRDPAPCRARVAQQARIERLHARKGVTRGQGCARTSVRRGPGCRPSRCASGTPSRSTPGTPARRASAPRRPRSSPSACSAWRTRS